MPVGGVCLVERKGSGLFEINLCSFEVMKGWNEGVINNNVNDGFFLTIVMILFWKIAIVFHRYIIFSVYYSSDYIVGYYCAYVGKGWVSYGFVLSKINFFVLSFFASIFIFSVLRNP